MIPIRDDQPRFSTPYVTYFLVALNTAVFLLELWVGFQSQRALNGFIYEFGVVPKHVTGALVGSPHFNLAAAFLPMLTSMFLHGGWLHIIGNMWVLWIFGDNVEDRMGPVRFLLFYLLCGLAAGVMHEYTNPDSTLPTVGASGAIAGVMGAYFFLFPYARVIVLLPVLFFPFFFELPAVTYLGFWMLAQVFSGALSLGNHGDVG